MVHALGGPVDFCERYTSYLKAAPVQRLVKAPRAGWVQAMQTRDIGLIVIALGGGRQRASDRIDARVGLSNMVQLGQHVEVGDTLAVIHAADASAALEAQQNLLGLIEMGDQPLTPRSPMVERVGNGAEAALRLNW
jgi:thymidine phosphorylase